MGRLCIRMSTEKQYDHERQQREKRRQYDQWLRTAKLEELPVQRDERMLRAMVMTEKNAEEDVEENADGAINAEEVRDKAATGDDEECGDNEGVKNVSREKYTEVDEKISERDAGESRDDEKEAAEKNGDEENAGREDDARNWQGEAEGDPVGKKDKTAQDADVSGEKPARRH
ncbi:hypothetical protein MTO96_028937 [Rhipicephalus appendiculatus]